jgi:glycosyltransferase involved in cell wall biosynthesis
VCVLRNGIDLERFTGVTAVDVRSEFDLADADVVIAMVANIHPRKNHGLALRALASLPANRHVGLLLLGDAPHAHLDYRLGLERLVDELELVGVRFVPGRRDIPGLLLGCDIGLLSSTAESGPLAVLEYMAAGLPFVATRVGQVTRDIAGTGAGLVVDAGDVDGFAAGLARLVAMTVPERTAMGVVGHRVAAEQFSLDANVDRLEEIYGELAGAAAPRSE